MSHGFAVLICLFLGACAGPAVVECDQCLDTLRTTGVGGASGQSVTVDHGGYLVRELVLYGPAPGRPEQRRWLCDEYLTVGAPAGAIPTNHCEGVRVDLTSGGTKK